MFMSNDENVFELMQFQQQVKNYFQLNKFNPINVKFLYNANEINQDKELSIHQNNVSLFYSTINNTTCKIDLTNFETNLLKWYPEFEEFKNNLNKLENKVCIAGGFISKILTQNWNQDEKIKLYKVQQPNDENTINSFDKLSDIDFFLYENQNIDTSNQLVNQICLLLQNYWNKQPNHIVSFIRYRNIINLYVYEKRPFKSEFISNPNLSKNYLVRKYQIICKYNVNMASFLYEFDLGSCQVAYDFKNLYFTKLGKFAYEKNINIFDTNNISNYLYEKRIIKYFYRGFNIVFPLQIYIETNTNSETELKFKTFSIYFLNKLNSNNITNYETITFKQQPIDVCSDITDNSQTISRTYSCIKIIDSLSSVNKRTKFIKEHNKNLYFLHLDNNFNSNFIKPFNMEGFKKDLLEENRWIYYYHNIFQNFDFTHQFVPFIGFEKSIQEMIVLKLFSDIWKNNTLNCSKLEYIFQSDISLLSNFISTLFKFKTEDEKLLFCQEKVYSKWFKPNEKEFINSTCLFVEIVNYLDSKEFIKQLPIDWSVSWNGYNDRHENHFSYFQDVEVVPSESSTSTEKLDF